MTGPFDGIYWPDAALNSVTQTFENVSVSITDCNGKQIEVTALGFIGHRMVGFWDEVIVESSTLVITHPFIDECVSAISMHHTDGVPDSGSLKRNHGESWLLWNLTLADGVSLQIVAREFRVLCL